MTREHFAEEIRDGRIRLSPLSPDEPQKGPMSAAEIARRDQRFREAARDYLADDGAADDGAADDETRDGGTSLLAAHPEHAGKEPGGRLEKDSEASGSPG